jgi:ADP-ribosylglycohydrolase
VKLTWINPVELVGHELNQLEQEGRDVMQLRRRWDASHAENTTPEALRRAAQMFLEELTPLSRLSADSAVEPSKLDEILALCAPRREDRSPRIPPDSVLGDRIAGGWFGRAAGCLLGKPVEKTTRDGIRRILSSNGSWPLSYYITAKGVPEDLLVRYPWNSHEGKESLRENILCMPEDDDMNYPMLNLAVLESAGLGFTTEQIARAWLTMLPILSTFTAERVAYMNCLDGLQPPETAILRNPYREWIGAQIRGDVFGWVSPGAPRRAATLAFRDAMLSHVRNGIYGEMFVAAMIAAAVVETDPREVVRSGLAFVPPGSRLAQAVRFALSLPEDEPAWEGAVNRLYEEFGHYHWVHTVNNAALVVGALMYGGGDFERSVCNVVMGGWDTDSNGATVGSILGTMLGASRLPARWIYPLNNRIRSSLRGFDNSAIDLLAQRTLKIALASTSSQEHHALQGRTTAQ